uniref:Cation-transporting P-type ATPase C-terminal domain-containing protein n=1 Tax=Hyaloperonospora arabidopsidis (strain Emoy2) TaxID=559515 RepID=M4C0G0_HYAAE
MRTARKRLLQTISRKIQEKEDSCNPTTEFRDPFLLLLALCASFRVADAIRRVAGEEDGDARGSTAVAEAAFLVAAAGGNVLLNLMQTRRHHAEMAERVRVAVQQMIRGRDQGKESVEQTHDETRASWIGAEPEPTVLLPSHSYIACYRDNQWQRLPMNLLVEGDVVGLMSGDIVPGEVRSVEISANEEQQVYPRGYKLPPWTRRHAKDATRCTATFDPPLLLELCGEMRIFEMRETPVVRDIDDALFRISRPVTPTQKLQAHARLVAVRICIWYSVLLLGAIGLRAVVQHRSLETALTHILQGPMGIWLCFASLNTPLVLFVAEAAATASILGSFDDILVPKESTKQKVSTKDRDSTVDGFAEKQGRVHAKTPDMNNEASKAAKNKGRSGAYTSHVDSAMASILKATALVQPDIYDVDDREKLRSAKAEKQSAVTRSLQYFLVVFRFRIMRCDLAHVSDRRHLPVPFRSFRLLERLGNITMLCCFDDDILCEQTPSVEEIFLLNDKQNNNSTVLDLHAERHCDTGLKFEDPRWKQHLPSLKPIGLAIMVNDDEHPARHYDENMHYLANEGLCPVDDDDSRDPSLQSCMQRLSAHIRMLPFPKHLLNLSREMGFCVAEDLTMFQRRQSIHIICPRLAHHEHTNDHHDQGQEDTRYRGNLKSHLYSTVILDRRSQRHQLLSRGHPTVVLAHCNEYWDGKSICPLTSEKQRAILDMYNQWRVEDLDCVAFSYVPVPHKLNNLFGRTGSSSNAPSQCSAPSLPNRLEGKLPPVYLVDDSTTSGLDSPHSPARRGSIPFSSNMDEEQGCGHECRRQRHSITPVSPLASPNSTDDTQIIQGLVPSKRTAKPMEAPSSGQVTPVRRRVMTFSDFESSAGPQPSETSSVEKESMLWRIQDNQIFLGMVATGVQPKQHTPDFIEDLNACGIRFVYFSPRNMRRSKLLAEKMGIETDWNCAISLRSLDSDDPDPHRMTSNYSDWDVKARLPHGVEAIKRHIAEVDNVPLLVSLYTDSTPETISEMISVFQENHEVVMGVGSSLKESNAPLFSKADLAVAFQGGVQAFFDKPIPCGKELPVLSNEDIQFSHILNSLACAFRLKSAPDDAENHNKRSVNVIDSMDNATRGGTASVAHLIELIRLGRRMLTNYYQMNTFIFVSQLFIATIILASYAVPFPHIPLLSCSSIFWLLWILVPVLSLSMLASACEKDVMKKTPRKNEEIDMEEDLARLIAYFFVRHVPSVLLSIAVFECLLGFSLQASHISNPDALGVKKFPNFHWTDFLCDYGLMTMRPRPAAVAAAMDRAEAVFFARDLLAPMESRYGNL